MMRKRNVLLTAVLTLSMMFSALVVPLPSWAAGSDTHYIAVASDRHRSTDTITAAMGNMPDSVEYVCLNGDMSSFGGSRPGSSGSGERPQRPADGERPQFPADGELPQGGSGMRAAKQQPYDTSAVLGEVQQAFPELDSSNVSIIYAAHDANATDDAGIMKCVDDAELAANESGADYAEISAGQSGCIYTGMDGSKAAYYVYGVSYYDMVDNGRGKDGEAFGKTAETEAEELKEFADENPDVPLIVIGHVPIHASRNDNLGASYWNDALNYAATGSEDGTSVIRDVVYLHGHNHTNEKDNETRRAIEYFISPGETLNVQGTEKNTSEESTIYYTYATAGYLNDNVSATLVKVQDGELSFQKYNGCRVSFDTGGAGKADSAAVKTGGKVTEPAGLSLEGYELAGWFKEAGCINKWDFDRDEVSDNMTLYAGWVTEWKWIDSSHHQRSFANDADHKETAFHTWEEVKVTKEATLFTKGVKLYKCTGCHASKAEEYSIKGEVKKAIKEKIKETVDRTVQWIRDIIESGKSDPEDPAAAEGSGEDSDSQPADEAAGTADGQNAEDQQNAADGQSTDNQQNNEDQQGSDDQQNNADQGTDGGSDAGSAAEGSGDAGSAASEPAVSKTVVKRVLAAVKIIAPKAGSRSAVIRWKKLSKKNLRKAAKVEIQLSTDRSFRKGVITKYAAAKKTSYRVGGLKKGKKYYVRVRAFTKEKGAVHVSKWSSVKKVKTK